VNQCSKNSKGNNKQPQKQLTRSANIFTEADGLASKLKTIFSMVLCLSINTISIVGWYLDSGASGHMSFNEKVFNKLQEKQLGMQVNLCNDIENHPSVSKC
jgi:hypothetical protein